MNKTEPELRERLRYIRYIISDWVRNHEALVALIFGLLCIARIFRLDYIFFPPSWWDGGNLDFSDAMVQNEMMIGYFIPDIPALLLAGLAIYFGRRAQKTYGVGLLGEGKGGIIIGVLCILSVLFINADDFMPLLTLTMTEAVHANPVNRTPHEDEYDLDLYTNVRPFGEEENGDTVWLVTVDGTLTNRTANTWRSVKLSYALINPDGSYVLKDGKKRIITTMKYTVQPGETIDITSDWYTPVRDEQPAYDYEIVSFEIRAPRYRP